MTTTYRAAVVTRPGGPEVLEIQDLPLTEPGRGELRVRIRACGVGATDQMILAGHYPFAPKPPVVAGYEMAGVVDAIGEDVAGFHVGQRVAALTVHGGFAEYIVREARHFVAIPDGVSDVEAAAVVLNYVTAWQMVHRVAKAGRGTRALVTAAAGGVGTALLQLLALAGATTYGAASSPKHALVEKLGAIPIDYRNRAIDRLVRAREADGVDVAFDAIGGKGTAEAIGALRRGGLVVGYGFMAARGQLAQLRTFLNVFIGSRLRGRRGSFYGITLKYRKDPKPFLEDLPKIFGLIAARQIEPVIAATFPLARVKDAITLSMSGSAAGKIVLTCD
jgi:NADPH:quinone reductase